MKKLLVVFILFTMLLSACSLGGQDSTNATTGNSGTAVENTGSSSVPSGNQESGSTAGQSTAQAQEPATVADYFPFVPNVMMSYKGTGNEYAAYETYVDYIRGDKMQLRKNNGGTEAVEVYLVKDGKLVNTFSRGETYYKYDYTSSTDGEDILLEEPIAVGTGWTAKDGSARSITSIDSQVDTPSGKYTAVEVTTKGKDSTIRDYYAKGIGLVKTVFSQADESSVITSELEKVEKDVPYVRTINCYYPQFEKDRVVYMERDIEIKTNEDMKFKFQKELKVIPEKGGLSKTLTKNTQVLGIKVDEDKGTVTVDLSQDFIREMNAGTSLEGMLLKSIVNTFGDYYLKSKVILTLDGKPYESGHVLMKPGEAFNVNTYRAAKFTE